MTLAVTMAAIMGGQALAVEWHPSRTQEEVGVVESTTTTTGGTTITVNKAPEAGQDAQQVTQVESAQQAVI